ncbi:SH3 domain-binding protein 2 isoform X3 [Nelusetta ayraudi]|uniref:SH3 domain-binding protein 2 isoform X3 n=1 Tax=Nelusetta ayraudi TaxID=303726 RepID=UPI003F70FCDC
MSTSMSAPSVRKKSIARSSKPSTRMCVREQRSVITMSSPEVYWPVPMRAIGAQNLLTMPGGVSTAGYLHKKGGSQFSLMKWPLRYIIIHKGCVYYFKSSTSPAPQGAFSLNGYNRVMRAAEETTSSNVFPFKVVHFSKKHRTWLFSAASEDERMKWMRFLRKEINHYNDRTDSHGFSSDSDSDPDGFYGTIETLMELKHPVDSTEDDYVDDDDDEEDEEDYMKPDSEYSPSSTGRPTGPPPAYPPPPVPFQPSSRLHKGPPPPLPPLHRLPNSPLPKKPPPAIPPPTLPKDFAKAPPSPVPFTHLPSALPDLPPPNVKRAAQSRLASTEGPGNDKTDSRNIPTVSFHSPPVVPMCQQFDNSLVLNGVSHGPPNPGGMKHLDVLNNLLSKHSPVNSGLSHLRPTGPKPLSHEQMPCALPPVPGQLPPSPRLNKPGIPKPPLTSPKPQLPPTKPRSPAVPFQTSPEGQSFRSHTVLESWRKDDQSRSSEGHEPDEDYENMQLPASVYIETTETSTVEKLFRETLISPPDGLYGIRNSGTKTSKVLVVWDVGISKARNYRLFREDHSIYLDSEMQFPDLPTLIEHYHNHPLPHHGSLRLQMPYTHPLST